MRVRWSQLVYRRPGSDNEVGLAMVYQTQGGEVMHFQDDKQQVGSEAKGYLALVPLSRGMEEELDEWVEIDPEVFLSRDRAVWDERPQNIEEKSLFKTWLQAMGELFSPRTPQTQKEHAKS